MKRHLLQILCALLACSSPALAAEPDFSHYFKTVFDGANGLPGGIANDIDQTKDGVLWIGTYGGLYRYSGSAFQWMSNMEAVKTVNCLYSDESGRLWIGTNDNGVSLCIGQEITNTLNKASGLSSNSVRSIVQDSYGRYYIGTTASLHVVTISGGIKVASSIGEVAYARSLSAGEDGGVAAVTADGRLFLLRDGAVADSRIDRKDGGTYSCAAFSPSGLLYAGTQGSRIDVFRTEHGGLARVRTIDCDTLKGINSIAFDDEGGMFVCADTGPGYVTSSGRAIAIEAGGFNNSVENMLVDCQGNFWFTSSRKGVLRMTPSVFVEEEGRYTAGRSVVNTVARWRGAVLMGTDSGLDIGSSSSADPLAYRILEKFRDVRIRCLRQDSRGHLWICTSGMGVWDVAPDGSMQGFDSSNGAGGDKFRTVLEAQGGMFAAGDSGVAFIRGGRAEYFVGNGEGGMPNPKVLCLMQWGDDEIFAGTDGNGIAVLRDGKVERILLQKDGLSSEIILRMVPDSKGGAYIVTGSGLCRMDGDGKIRRLSSFPYYNNFDLAEGPGGMIFVTSSAGIYITSRKALLGSGPLRYALYNARNGMGLDLVPNAWNDLGDDGNWWLSCKTGAVLMNLNRYEIKVRSYRMLLETVLLDGVPHRVEKGEPIRIGSGVQRVEFVPEIVNYTVKDPYVATYLEGIDKAKAVRPQSALGTVSYTNLPPGSYSFHVAVLDSETGGAVSEAAYPVIKEAEFKDHWWFRAYAALVAMMLSSYLSWLGARLWMGRMLREQRDKLERQASQLRMVNETILTIAQAVDAKDERTSQHSRRVADYAVMIARRLGYGERQCENLRQVALLHDIGKIGIPDRVLNKPGRLTDEEYAVMKTHVTRGAAILKDFTIIDNVAEGALYHHERYDGRGYARGLKGEEIPLNARIIGIADAFDAMTSNRVYRGRLDIEYAKKEIARGRGTQFDPKLADIMLSLIEDGTIDIQKIYGIKAGGEGGTTKAASCKEGAHG